MKLPSEPPCGKDQCIDSTVCSYPLVIGANPVDYSEYMWMGEEMEEFDRKCLEELVEDEFIEYCIEQMLEEEDKVYNYIQFYVDDNPDAEPDIILQHLHAYARNNNIELEFLQDPTSRGCSQHLLNPEAPEFVPSHIQPVPGDTPHDR